MIWFVLGREFRLSIAEISSFFDNSKCLFADKQIALFEWITEKEVIDNFKKLWWSIKAISVEKEIFNEKNFITESIKLIQNNPNLSDSKFPFAIANYWTLMRIFTTWIQIKKELKKCGIANSRFINKDDKNINAATFKKEKIKTNWIEINFIKFENKYLIWETIAFQDVDEYSSRDYGKTRDMEVGMLPPKLAQMMINIWLKKVESKNFWEKKGVYEKKDTNSSTILTSNYINSHFNTVLYDPFCWLWTVLIEWILMWYKTIYWSDISDDMVFASQKNTQDFSKNKIKIFQMDARNIDKIEKNIYNSPNTSIVTEWYLGSIMTAWHVTMDKIQAERVKLAGIYEKFFWWLKKIKFKWNIVISFPFWQLKGKYIYLEEIYNILKKNNFKPIRLLPESIEFKETRSWSLLYHRPNQQVGREIFCLKLDI